MAEYNNRNFFEKKGIRLFDVMYITRNGRKSVINLADGRKIETFNPIKSLIETLPEDTFESINKGIVISPRYVADVKGNQYIMEDGMAFTGRVRATRKQKENMAKYNGSNQVYEWEPYAILDNMPLAFCVIELVFNEKGHGIDFIFRYCNKEMEVLEGKTIGEMVDKSFYEVFENGDKKWLVTYADIALNGGQKIIEAFSPEVNANLRICCYQPKPNFCACALIKV